MNLEALINKVHRNMPETTVVQAASHLNWAYKELISQDVDSFLFYGGKGIINSSEDNAWQNNDPYTKYPILYKLKEDSDPGTYNKDSSPLLEKDWNTFNDPKNYNALNDEGFSGCEIEFDLDFDDVLNFTHFCNSYKVPILMEVNGYPIVVRKVKNIFTFKGKNFIDNIFGISSKPFSTSIRYPLIGYDDLVSVPFTQKEKTNSSNCTIHMEGDYFNVKSPFFVEFYFEPPDIINGESPCFLNLQNYSTLLFEGAMGDYEEEINSLSQRKEMFLNNMKFQFKREKATHKTNTSSKYMRSL